MLDMLTGIKKFIQNFYIYILIFCVGLGLRMYALSLFPDLQIDEPCSYIVSTTSNRLDKDTLFKESWGKYNFKVGKNYTAKEVQKALFVGQDGVKGILRDWYILRKNNLDRQHPTLYYSVLRAWNSVLGDFNYDKYQSHARNLNLVFYCFSYIFLFLLLKNIKDDKRFISIALLFAFTNSGGIMLDTEAREYAMMEMFLIMSTYFGFDIIKKIFKCNSISLKLAIVSSIVFSLFMLSGYFSLIYLSLLAILIWFICLYKRSWKYLPILLGILAMSLLITYFIYPDYYNFSYDNEHYATVSSGFKTLLCFDNLSKKLPLFFQHLNRYAFYTFIIVLIVFWMVLFYILPTKDMIKEPLPAKDTKITLALFGFATIWAIIVALVQPFDYYSRYVMPGISLCMLILALISYRFKPIMLTAIVLLYLHTGFMQIDEGKLLDNDRIKYGFNNVVPKFRSHVINTKYNTPGHHVINKNLPIVFVKPSTYVVGQYMFANVSANNIIRFEDNIPPPKYMFDKYILICNKNKLKFIKPMYTIRGNLAVYEMPFQLLNIRSKKSTTQRKN